jgi:hypothetical protein
MQACHSANVCITNNYILTENGKASTLNLTTRTLENHCQNVHISLFNHTVLLTIRIGSSHYGTVLRDVVQTLCLRLFFAVCAFATKVS